MTDIGWGWSSLADLVQQIRTDLLTSLSADNVLRRSDLDVQARVQAAAWHTVNGFIEFLALEILPDTATAWLEHHGNWRDIRRKQPTPATGDVRRGDLARNADREAAATTACREWATGIRGSPRSGSEDQ